MDRTSEWLEAVEYACQEQHVSLDQLRAAAQSKSSTSFTKVTTSVIQSIANLRDFIRLHQKDYLGSTVYSEHDKDSIEAEVGLTVKAVGQQIEALKNSVLAAQASPLAPPAAIAALQEQQQALGVSARGPTINEQTAAHLHGVVLCLAESLHAVTSRFDKARAQRYQQIQERDARRAAAHAIASSQTSSTSAGAAASAAAPFSSSQPSQPAASWIPSGITQGLSNAGADKAAAQALRMGTALLGRVKGASEVLRGAGEAAWSAASGQAAGSSGGGAGPGVRGPFGLGSRVGSNSNVQASGASTSQFSSSQAMQAATGPPAPPPQMSQQQVLLEAENQGLVERLSQMAQGVQGVERTVKEIAILNQMFSTAILHQAEAIETIYNQAVEASQNIKLGNKELKKTVAVNRSTQKHIIVLLLAATIGLLFLDWFNS